MTIRDRMLDDTSLEALAAQLRVLRQLGPSGRAAMTFELCDNIRRLVRDGIRHRHPDWDDRSVEREAIRLMIGDSLFQRAYGKEPAAP